MPLFFLKSGTLVFVIFGIIISNVPPSCLRRAFVVPSSCLRFCLLSKGGGKGHPKWDKKVLVSTYPFSG